MKMDQQELNRLKKVILESSEGDQFSLHLYETLPSKLIQDAIEDEIHIDQDETEVEIEPETEAENEINSEHKKAPIAVIQLVNVQTNTLKNVVNFLRHHAIDPLKPIPSQINGSSFQEIIQQEWYLRFMDDLHASSKKELFELVAASNYMDIACLFNLACLRVSFMLMGKKPEEIRQILDLPKLSKEEERMAREEHPWMFED
jgi:S-phase kinase-associated protein 1